MIQVRNTADGLVHATKKTLEEAGDKATAEEKEAIEKAQKGGGRGSQVLSEANQPQLPSQFENI